MSDASETSRADRPLAAGERTVPVAAFFGRMARRDGLVRFVGGAAVLSATAAGARLLSMTTMLLYARLLDERQFGTAMAAMAPVFLVQMLRDLGLDQRLLKADADRVDAELPVVHAVTGVQCLTASTLLAAAAYPASDLFGLDSATPMLMTALVPTVSMLQHRSYILKQRAGVFAPMAAVGLPGEVVCLAAAWPLVEWFGDYRAWIANVYLRIAIGVAASWLMADRPFRWSFDRALLLDIAHYGWPLMLNGLLLYAGNEAFRVVVGACGTLPELATYSLAMALAVFPGSLAISVCNRLFVARVASATGEARMEALRSLRAATCAGAFLLIGGVGTCLPLVSRFLSDDSYEGLIPVCTLLSAATAFRILQTNSSIPIVSSSRTRPLLAGSLVRGVGLATAAAGAAAGGGLTVIAGGKLLGDFCGFLVSRRVSGRVAGPLPSLVVPAVATAGLAGLTTALAGRLSDPVDPLACAAVAIAAVAGIAACVADFLRQWRPASPGESAADEVIDV